MKFVCLDFETANSSRSSVCSIGISVYENGEMVEEKEWLVRPEPLYFEPRNIMVHNIREVDVLGEKTFPEIWSEIKPYLENQLVVAHNASFDLSVLRNTLDYYNLEWPTLRYCCTLVASRIFYNYLPSFKLNVVAKYLGFKGLKHHKASSDATAAGYILTQIFEELETDDIDEVAEIVGFSLGYLNEETYSPCSKKYIGMVSGMREVFTGIDEMDEVDESVDFFRDKYVVFTGPLGIMERDQAESIVTRLGGIPWRNVTKKTNILVTNVENPESLDPMCMSRKLATAMRYKQQGQEIILLNAEEFQNIILGYPYDREEESHG